MTVQGKKCIWVKNCFKKKLFNLYPVLKAIAHNYFNYILHVIIRVVSNVYHCFYRKSSSGLVGFPQTYSNVSRRKMPILVMI